MITIDYVLRLYMAKVLTAWLWKQIARASSLFCVLEFAAETATGKGCKPTMKPVLSLPWLSTTRTYQNPPMTKQLSFYAQKASSQTLISIETYSIIFMYKCIETSDCLRSDIPCVAALHDFHHFQALLALELLQAAPLALSHFQKPTITYKKICPAKEIICKVKWPMADESLWLMNVDECWLMLMNAMNTMKVDDILCGKIKIKTFSPPRQHQRRLVWLLGSHWRPLASWRSGLIAKHMKGSFRRQNDTKPFNYCIKIQWFLHLVLDQCGAVPDIEQPSEEDDILRVLICSHDESDHVQPTLQCPGAQSTPKQTRCTVPGVCMCAPLAVFHFIVYHHPIFQSLESHDLFSMGTHELYD